MDSAFHHGITLAMVFLCCSPRVHAFLDSPLGGTQSSYWATDDYEACGTRKARVFPGMVIQPKQSTAAGAHFLDSMNTTSKDECFSLCCQTNLCTVAVFQAKGSQSKRYSSSSGRYGDGMDSLSYFARRKRKVHPCYLFNCLADGVCVFQAQSEYDYIEIETSSSLRSFVETARPPTTRAPLFNLALYARCKGRDLCAGQDSECRSGACQCRPGFHPKNGVCRRDCSPTTEFECANGQSQYVQPDCVPVYDVCDGVAQCSDGSDERGCQVGSGKAGEPVLPWSDVEQGPGDSRNDKSNGRPGLGVTGYKESAMSGGQYAHKSATPASTSTKSHSQPSSATARATSRPTTAVPSSSKTTAPALPPRQSPTIAGSPKHSDTQGTAQASTAARGKSEGAVGHSPSDKAGDKTGDRSGDKADDNTGDKADDNTSDKKELAEDADLQAAGKGGGKPASLHSNTGVWLSILLLTGVALMLILAGYAGCRYKRSKPYKVRLGIPKEDEGDYLINGMYL